MLVSAVRQYESAIGIHVSPPSWISLPSPTPSYPSRLSKLARYFNEWTFRDIFNATGMMIKLYFSKKKLTDQYSDLNLELYQDFQPFKSSDLKWLDEGFIWLGVGRMGTPKLHQRENCEGTNSFSASPLGQSGKEHLWSHILFAFANEFCKHEFS